MSRSKFQPPWPCWLLFCTAGHALLAASRRVRRLHPLRWFSARAACSGRFTSMCRRAPGLGAKLLWHPSCLASVSAAPRGCSAALAHAAAGGISRTAALQLCRNAASCVQLPSCAWSSPLTQHGVRQAATGARRRGDLHHQGRRPGPSPLLRAPIFGHHRHPSPNRAAQNPTIARPGVSVHTLPTQVSSWMHTALVGKSGIL